MRVKFNPIRFIRFFVGFAIGVTIVFLCRLALAQAPAQWPTPIVIERTAPYSLPKTGICKPDPTNPNWVPPYGCILSLEEYSFAAVWVGLTLPFPDTRIYVWTTSSFSPFVNEPYPWNLIGEYEKSWPEWELQPYIDAAERISPGYRIVPIPKRKRRRFNDDGTDSWVDDPRMRVVIYLGPPGCDVPVCGAIPVLPRTDFSLLATTTTTKAQPAIKRREVRQ